MSSRVVALLAIPLVVLAWYAGVKTGERNSGGADGLLPVVSRPGTPLARFDGQAISVEELQSQINEQTPFVRARYANVEGRRELLESMVRLELLAREAQRLGYHRDPDVLRQYKRNMVAVFVQKEFEEPHQKQPVSDDEIARFYETHKDDYVKPERVRIAQIFFDAPAADAEARAKKKAEAEAMLADLRARDPQEYAAFGQLARERSDDADSKAAGGDLHFLSREQLAAKAGPEFAELAFGLRDIGTVHPQLVETPRGFHVVKLLGRENALDLKLTEVRDSVRNRLVFDRRAQAYQQFLSGLERKANLTIDTAALNAMKVDTGAGALPPGLNAPAPVERVPAGDGHEH